MLFAAFAGLAFRTEHDVTLKTGEAFETKDPYGHQWRFVSQGVSTSNSIDRDVVAVGLEMFRDGKRMGVISSEKRTLRRLAPESALPADHRSRDSHHREARHLPRARRCSWSRHRRAARDVQSARRVGMDRRLSHDDRRPRRHVAAGRASPRAGRICRGDATLAAGGRDSSFSMTKFGSTTRRDFLARIAGASAAAAVMSRTAGAQQRGADARLEHRPTRHDQPVRDGSERGAYGAASAQAWRNRGVDDRATR